MHYHLGIDVEYPIPHIHIQNGLARVFIKRLACTLLLRTKPPILETYAASYLRLRTVANHQYSLLQSFVRLRTIIPTINTLFYNLLLRGNPIFHIWGFLVVKLMCLLIVPSQCTKIGPQRGVHGLPGCIDFNSPHIIRYISNPSRVDL